MAPKKGPIELICMRAFGLITEAIKLLKTNPENSILLLREAESLLLKLEKVGRGIGPSSLRAIRYVQKLIDEGILENDDPKIKGYSELIVEEITEAMRLARGAGL